MEQRLSTGGPPVRIFAVDHMMFGGSEQQGTSEPSSRSVWSRSRSARRSAFRTILRRLSACRIRARFSPDLPMCVADSANDTGLTGTPTCIAHRLSLPLFGDGLVEATSDQTFQSIAAAEPTAIRGTVRMVADIDNFDGLASEVSPA